MILVALSTVFAYSLVRPLFDEVLDVKAETSAESTHDGFVGLLDASHGRLSSWLSPHLPSRSAATLLMILAAIAIKNLATLLSRYATARFGLATIRDLRQNLYESLLGQSQSFFHSHPVSLMTAHMVNDIQLIREALAERFADLVLDLLTIIGLLVFVFSLNFKLAAATFVAAPVLIAPVLFFSRKLRTQSRRSQEQMGELTSVLDDSLRGIRAVQAFSMIGHFSTRFARAANDHFKAQLLARTVQAANAPVMEIVGTGAGLLLVAWASKQISAGVMSLGDLSAFLIAVYGTYNPIKRLNKFNLSLQQATVAAERVFGVIDTPPDIADRPRARPLEHRNPGIQFQEVAFSYEEGQPVLENIDLDIPPGSRTALVGPSGAGKSTLAQLIPRFWDVDRGAVLVGGADVRDLQLASLRSHIGMVTQETILFNDTVRTNITAGNPDLSFSEIERAAEMALAADFIRELPQGYDTIIGESGLRLSGGQRQRLAIARALIIDPPILVLDEATSALDPESEELVRQALDNLMRTRTTLVIAHRLSTIRNADQIIVLESGRIVERGDHDSLRSAGGLYNRLHSSFEDSQTAIPRGQR